MSIRSIGNKRGQVVRDLLEAVRQKTLKASVRQDSGLTQIAYWYLPDAIFALRGSQEGVYPFLLKVTTRAVSIALRLDLGTVESILRKNRGEGGHVRLLDFFYQVCQSNLLLKLREELDNGLAASKLRSKSSRENIFTLLDRALNSLGFTRGNKYYFDELGEERLVGDRLRPMDTRVASIDLPAVEDFAQSRDNFRYADDRLFLRLNFSKEGSFIIVAEGAPRLPGGQATVELVATVLRRRLRDAFSLTVERERQARTIERRDALDRLIDKLDKQPEPNGNASLSMGSAVMEYLRETHPHLRSASLAVWDRDERALVSIASLGVEHHFISASIELTADPDASGEFASVSERPFSRAARLLDQGREALIHADQESSGAAILGIPQDKHGPGHFAIFPLYADAKERQQPLGALSMRMEAGRYLDPDKVVVLQRLAKYLESRMRAYHFHWKSKQDALTGLLNRGGGEEMLEADFAQAGKHPLSLLMLDLDHFKQVNDDHGHPAGDQVLRRLGEILRSAASNAYATASISGTAEPYAMRYGGEEFCLILPQMTLKQAQMVAERLRSAIENTPFEIGFDRALSKTASIGVAASHNGTPFRSVTELIEAADAALYAAKGDDQVSGGIRNRVAVASSRKIRTSGDFSFPYWTPPR
ncbi:MAG: GGDEF domain-containing protein [Candidatus Saganbacteria bacterium]|nr:GGDEF domain-containing protein [Candidatus Saganbacteria bacterium]